MDSTDTSSWRRFLNRDEFKPLRTLLVHGATLLGASVVLGIGHPALDLLKRVVGHDALIEIIQEVDLWFILGCLCLFGLEMFVQLSGMAGAALWEAWPGKLCRFLWKSYGERNPTKREQTQEQTDPTKRGDK